MPTAYCPKSHELLSRQSVGTEYHLPGKQYHNVDVVISRRGQTYRCHVVDHWGTVQQGDEEHGRLQAIGRSDCVEEAVRLAKHDGLAVGMNAEYLIQALSLAEDEALELVEDDEE